MLSHFLTYHERIWVLKLNLRIIYLWQADLERDQGGSLSHWR